MRLYPLLKISVSVDLLQAMRSLILIMFYQEKEGVKEPLPQGYNYREYTLDCMMSVDCRIIIDCRILMVVVEKRLTIEVGKLGYDPAILQTTIPAPSSPASLLVPHDQKCGNSSTACGTKSTPDDDDEKNHLTDETMEKPT